MRKIILKIVIALLVIGVSIGAVQIWNRTVKKGNDEKGSITITIKDLSNKEESKTISFKKEDTFLEVLDREYDIRYENGSYGTILYDIDWIKTDFKNTYLAIYIDGKYATVGISSIELVDGMKILFEETVI